MWDSYRIKTAATGVKRLATLSPEDKQGCIDAYRFFQRMQAGEETETAQETKAVADYYKVLNNMLSVFDLEKLYIPPMLDMTKGLYDNQILTEKALLADLALHDPAGSHLLDMGCGRGRIAHHLATLTGGQVSGYNIDPDQVENGIDWAARCGMSDRLHFKVGNHHEPLEYESESFDGCFSVQAVWPFFKKEELDLHAREMYRVLKPGARYACSEYLLTPYFDWENEEHVALHRLFLPTLAATRSMYPADVCGALERAGFHIELSAPSRSEAWPLCDQKSDLIRRGRHLVRALEKIKVAPAWIEESLELLQRGGEAWNEAERAKIADLNWRIVATKQ
ncbi:class I SAM-dependent methyltransferase [Aeromicrobium sp. A1-2]|uniref:class I SAM-dependent methyltransferase n=1 Tax=Aeromicrobium sp. A1-2 TaxID=2107713 RepID=UPI000E550384|nr:class I SAM-dependent methyltransferase [Aeromicrobium sp. A1-2]AXT84289.1 class I SAM-dependent methyltransferase [Aeromicrobium sp. A1-2]